MEWGFQSDRRFKITAELTRLLAEQTEFFKTTSRTPEKLRAYAKSRERVRELFAELEQLRKAA
jgi:hypothetical protein